MIPLLELMQISNPDQLLNLEAGAFNNLPFHFYWKDNKGKYLGCNDTQALFVGLEKGSDLFGCTDYDLCWSKYASTVQQHDLEVMVKDNTKSFIEPGFDLDDSDLFFFSHKIPLRLRNNKVTGIIGVSFPLNKDDWYLTHNKNPEKKYFSIDGIRLSERQVDCLYYLIKGMTLKQIAKTLDLSPKTVEHYLDAVKIKLNCRNRTELIVKGLELSYIKDRL